MKILIASTPATGHIDPMFSLGHLLVRAGHEVVGLSANAMRDRIAGGRSVDAIPGPIPGNARLASYLPFDWLLPKVDAFVTNGGYGSVNQALSFGIPLVTAGLSEDKADGNARVAWSGVGIDLKTQEPTSSALREAVRAVLDKPNYRSRASSMAEEFARIDTRSQILRILNQVSCAGAK